MTLPVLRASLLAACVLAFLPAASQAQRRTIHTFTVSGRDFLMDGKPYQVISGEMHYPRIPREYWRDRLQKAKAMGLNTITTYAFWNLHEPRPGVYDFSGQNDLAAFLRDAQAEGLNVILRPGPYVCAEWELGGYPSWLLKDRTLTLRSTNPAYHAAVQRWFQRLATEVKPLLLKNGGPIIAVQVENEYGAFGDDLNYLRQVKDDMLHAGLGDGLMFTSNQASDLAKGSLPDLPATVNFGSGNAEASTAMLEKFRPNGPRMVGEYWAGWFDKWGEEHHETDGRKEAQEFQWMLEHGYSVSMYMFHGGSSFGWMNGADSHTGKDYHPDTTSYDYDAPLDESGSPRYKYALLQQAIATATHTKPMPVPKASERRVFPIAAAKESASLWDNLPASVHSETPLTFEDLDQNYGYVLYRSKLPAHAGGTLTINGLHDYAVVYVDRKQVGILDRRLDQSTLTLPSNLREGSALDILVENTGRVNYSHAILTERTGITGTVLLGGAEVEGWEMFSFPMQDLSHLQFRSGPCTGPCFFRTAMSVDQPADTFLDTRGLHKGQLWLGSHNLGRFWSIGPQFTLYSPAPWLHSGMNTITWFDLKGDSRNEALTSVHDPVYGAVTHSRESQ
ncbi:beta-galactosidase family protein [Terriglobus sp. TAA 43]|uniref:glycoside hydrolase family 35 protein n=1 Tax=Terriglobus sp. TAA 43 TaxID=278961 RepID=UPI0006471263|nr:beta-galactosidase family protein [Terriglobus sp. TAA 43]